MWNAMEFSELAAVILIGAVMALLVSVGFRDWLRKRRRVASLAARVQRNDEQFGQDYFPDAKRADAAVRVRRILSKNLEMPLGGLVPSDRLNEDLRAELPANPHLFWELEEEFGIRIDMDDMESFEKTLQRLVTFQDLLEFVEKRIAEPLAESPGQREEEEPSPAYEFAIRSIPVLFVVGLVGLVSGIILDKNRVTNISTVIFTSGFAVWGFANGGEMLRTLILEMRAMSFKEIAVRKWKLVFVTCLVVFFLSVGIFISWAVLNNVFFR